LDSGLTDSARAVMRPAESLRGAANSTAPWAAEGTIEAVPLQEPAKGMLILDVVDRVITQIEILYRNDIRQRLLAVLP